MTGRLISGVYAWPAETALNWLHLADPTAATQTFAGISTSPPEVLAYWEQVAVPKMAAQTLTGTLMVAGRGGTTAGTAYHIVRCSTACRFKRRITTAETASRVPTSAKKAEVIMDFILRCSAGNTTVIGPVGWYADEGVT